ncbi:hypothetical protein D918_05700 [Trichuris suis]|nr:hypothetical protein D918_05700 [Trichuris suis]
MVKLMYVCKYLASTGSFPFFCSVTQITYAAVSLPRYREWQSVEDDGNSRDSPVVLCLTSLMNEKNFFEKVGDSDEKLTIEMNVCRNG